MEINIDDIREGSPGLTKYLGCTFFEACFISLYRNEHFNSDIKLQLTGDTEDEVKIFCNYEFTDQLNAAWRDQRDATEFGACCLSILLSKKLTSFTVIERSMKGDGFDYWLGNDDDILFQKKARLEVSGIFKGDNNAVNQRYKEKTTQTNQSDNTLLPAYISIIEFGKPLAKFGKKK